MYSVLNLSWNEMMNADYSYKSNTHHKVVEFEKGSEIQGYCDDSVILIYYNMYTSLPMILIEKVPSGIPLTKEDVKSRLGDNLNGLFHVNVVEEEDSNQIILTRRDLYDAIIAEDNSMQ